MPLCEGLTIQRRVECGKEAVIAKGFGTNLFENAFAMKHNVSQGELETVQVREIQLLRRSCVIDVAVSPAFRNSEEILKGEARGECLIRYGTNVLIKMLCPTGNRMTNRGKSGIMVFFDLA